MKLKRWLKHQQGGQERREQPDTIFLLPTGEMLWRLFAFDSFSPLLLGAMKSNYPFHKSLLILGDFQ